MKNTRGGNTELIHKPIYSSIQKDDLSHKKSTAIVSDSQSKMITPINCETTISKMRHISKQYDG